MKSPYFFKDNLVYVFSVAQVCKYSTQHKLHNIVLYSHK